MSTWASSAPFPSLTLSPPAQDSFSSEYFYPLLQPWRHYIPISFSLDDVRSRLEWAKANPSTAEEIAATGKRFAQEHLHTHAVACYWWQLLTELAALQNFEPRADGFKPL